MKLEKLASANVALDTKDLYIKQPKNIDPHALSQLLDTQLDLVTEYSALFSSFKETHKEGLEVFQTDPYSTLFTIVHFTAEVLEKLKHNLKSQKRTQIDNMNAFLTLYAQERKSLESLEEIYTQIQPIDSQEYAQLQSQSKYAKIMAFYAFIESQIKRTLQARTPVYTHSLTEPSGYLSQGTVVHIKGKKDTFHKITVKHPTKGETIAYIKESI